MVGQCEATSAAGLNLKHIGDFPQPDVSARGPFVTKKSITYASIRDGNGPRWTLARHLYIRWPTWCIFITALVLWNLLFAAAP